MKYSEIFDSIQGEGPIQGHPCTFIRMAGCNLDCAWCDTPYSRPVGSGKTIGSHELSMIIRNRILQKDFWKHIVFTGGEPLLQQDGILKTLRSYMKDTAIIPKVWFETNGTIAPKEALDQSVRPYYVVSPKKDHACANVLSKFPYDRTYLKFVMEWIDGEWSWTEEEISEIAGLTVTGVRRDRIFLMPQSRTRDELLENGPRVWQLCTDRGFAFSSRLHIVYFSDRRGV